jgi:hypothetical protein
VRPTKNSPSLRSIKTSSDEGVRSSELLCCNSVHAPVLLHFIRYRIPRPRPRSIFLRIGEPTDEISSPRRSHTTWKSSSRSLGYLTIKSSSINVGNCILIACSAGLGAFSSSHDLSTSSDARDRCRDICTVWVLPEDQYLLQNLPDRHTWSNPSMPSTATTFLNSRSKSARRRVEEASGILTDPTLFDTRAARRRVSSPIAWLQT